MDRMDSKMNHVSTDLKTSTACSPTMDFATENLEREDFLMSFGWIPDRRLRNTLTLTIALYRETKPCSTQVFKHRINIHSYVHLQALLEEKVVYLCFRTLDRIHKEQQ